MATLELECPSCGELLELDAGFAGSVCRCSRCGTLMTVPTDPEASAERVERPDAPPGTRPEVPTIHSAGPAGTGTAPDDGGATEAETRSTASEHTVRLERNAPAPPVASSKRPSVRLLTVVVVVLVSLALVGWTIGALVFTMGGGSESTDGPNAAFEQFGYDPSVNPYVLDRLNVLALPVRSRSAVVVDASGSSRQWLALVQDAVRLGLTQDQDQAEVGLVYATEAAPRPFAEGLQPASQLAVERLHTFQQSVAAAGVAPLIPAVEAALAWGPEQVILITGQRMDEAQADLIEAALAEKNGVRLDVVLVGEESSSAEALAEAHGGRYVRLSLGQLRRWYRAADVPVP